MPVPQPCPLCSDTRFREIKRFPDGVVVGECEGCGLVYTPLRHDAPETVHGDAPIEALRERYGPILRGERRHYRAKAYRDYLRRIERHVAGGSLLDVGCAHGFFLDEARREGFRVAGIEAHPDMARFAREGLGLDVVEGLWARADPPAGLWDVITFNDCLEYMPDPVSALRKACDRLAPGGIVFVKTPNAAYFRLRHRIARVLGRDLGTGEAFDPSTRVVHFATDTLLRALKAARLKPLEAGIPRAVPSPRWHRADGVWLEWEAPSWHAVPERITRRLLQGLGRTEIALTRGGNHLSSSIYAIARAAGPS